jgi:23S rRNA (adenine1618-N6)-methyltransferase
LKKIHPPIKSGLHPRNQHRARYDFPELIQSNPALGSFVRTNEHGDESIDFSNPLAVKTLNQTLLKQYYGLEYWDIPEGYLCPPVPGRADYIHYAADLLADSGSRKKENAPPVNAAIKCLDIGVGANCIYEIVGNYTYGWQFVASDIDPVALRSAEKIITTNPSLKGCTEFRLQTHSKNTLSGIIQPGEFFDLSICNPPFHSSAAAAKEGTLRKLRNLKIKTAQKPELNFGGQSNELWCPGGEVKFIGDMIRESKNFGNSCHWFTSLVAKSEHLPPLHKIMREVKVTDFQTINMHQGNKASRFVAWTFLDPE